MERQNKAMVANRAFRKKGTGPAGTLDDLRRNLKNVLHKNAGQTRSTGTTRSSRNAVFLVGQDMASKTLACPPV
jgi:hypothetical protein